MADIFTIALAVTGGPVTPRIINVALGNAAARIHSKRGRVICLSGGFGPLLKGNRSGVFDVSRQIARDWLTQRRCDMQTERILPRREPAEWNRIAGTLREMKVNGLITIGGNGSGCTLRWLFENLKDNPLRMVQIPKSMDDDYVGSSICLGAETAVQRAIEEVTAYNDEASLTGGLSIVRFLGREAGHFALRVAAGAEAVLVLIPEEFGKEITLKVRQLVDMIVLTQIEAYCFLGGFGMTIFSEGILDCIEPSERTLLGATPSREHPERTNFSVATPEKHLSELVSRRLHELGVDPLGIGVLASARSVGYYARAGKPVDADLELARSYGEKAADLICGDDPLPCPMVVTQGKPILLTDLYSDDGEVRQHFVDVANGDYGRSKNVQRRVLPRDLPRVAAAFRDRFGDTETARNFREIFGPTAELFAKLPAK